MSFDKAMSFAVEGDGRDLPLWFRLAMPVPPLLVSGI